MDWAVEIRNLSYPSGAEAVLRELSLRVARGETYALLGASGSGKSLLVSVLAGLVPVGPGSVFVERTDLASSSKKELLNFRKRLGLVLQEGALISNLSLYDNIALPLRYHEGSGEREVGERVGEIMALLELNRNFDRALPAQAGMETRKRAAFARALILKPSFLLLDEPAAGLGEEAVRRLIAVIRRYREREKATVFFTAGDWPLALALAGRAGILKDGRIRLEGPPLEIREKTGREKFQDPLRPAEPSGGESPGPDRGQGV